jgi:cytochrome P450
MLPPGPGAAPLVQLWRWISNPFGFMDAAARRFGDTFTVRAAGLGTYVFFSAPEDLRAIFTADPEVLLSGAANAFLAPLLGENSLITLDRAAHLRQRRLLLPPFQGERMQAYAAVMQDAALRNLAGWPAGAPFALHPRMQAITFDVILRTVFGSEDAAAKRRLGPPLERLLALTAGSRFSLLIPAAFQLVGNRGLDSISRRIRADADRALFAEIAARRAAPGGEAREDVLSLLLRARDEAGAPMTDEELRDELVTLLVAGHDTTATALAWAFQLILAHREARERVEAEIAQAGAPPGGLDAAALGRLEYLDAAIKESLRLRPIIPNVGRRVAAPFTVGGVTVPAGVNLAPCIYLAHRRAETYPEPEVFRPERFLGQKADPYAWFPFGGGMRRCIGIWFALFEMKVVIATVLGAARLELAGGLERPERRGITLVPSGGTRVVLAGARAGAGRPLAAAAR